MGVPEMLVDDRQDFLAGGEALLHDRIEDALLLILRFREHADELARQMLAAQRDATWRSVHPDTTRDPSTRPIMPRSGLGSPGCDCPVMHSR
jgi:hypothetical protein